MADTFPALLCQNKNCKPMFLPRAELAHPEQPAWPADDAERSFICPTCKEQQTYSIGDVRQVNLDSLYRQQNVVRIAVRCRENDCDTQSDPQYKRKGDRKTKALIVTRTLLAFDVPQVSVREQALEIFAQFARKTVREIRCEKKHPLDRQRYHPEVQDEAGYDRAWQHLEPSK